MAVAIIFSGGSAIGYDNTGGYDNKTVYNQQAYENNGGYKNDVPYHVEFLKGKKRLQKVQTEDGRQAVIPIGSPEDEMKEERKLKK